MLLNYNQGTTVVDLTPVNLQSFLQSVQPKTSSAGGSGGGLHYHFIFRANDVGMHALGAAEREKFYRFIAGCVRALEGEGEAVAGSGGKNESIHLLVSLDRSHNPADFVCKLKLLTASWARRNLNLKDFSWQEKEDVFTVSQSQRHYLSQSIRRASQTFLCPKTIASN